MHSTRFVLVDRRLRVRAVYRTDEDDAISHLLHDIRTVRAEKA